MDFNTWVILQRNYKLVQSKTALNPEKATANPLDLKKNASRRRGLQSASPSANRPLCE